jgi:hypothetical protein
MSAQSWDFIKEKHGIKIYKRVEAGKLLKSYALTGVIPESKDMVRIKDYRQTWTIISVGKEMTHIELEAFVDPAGSIPKWISNMLIIESPLKAISGLKESMGGK